MKNTTLILLTLVVLQGCMKAGTDHNCISYIKSPVSAVSGAKTGSVNQTIPLAVDFVSSNGCCNSGNFEQTANGNTRVINVMAKYQGCMCTQVMGTVQATYNFTANQTGTYDLRFYQSENMYLTHTITIQ